MGINGPFVQNWGHCTVHRVEAQRSWLSLRIRVSYLRPPPNIPIGRDKFRAAEAMEMGADAVLVNTALAAAGDPAAMGKAFADAVRAGRTAYRCGLAPKSTSAEASSPLTSFLS